MELAFLFRCLQMIEEEWMGRDRDWDDEGFEEVGMA
jgi:hypothetical protein